MRRSQSSGLVTIHALRRAGAIGAVLMLVMLVLGVAFAVLFAVARLVVAILSRVFAVRPAPQWDPRSFVAPRRAGRFLASDSDIEAIAQWYDETHPNPLRA